MLPVVRGWQFFIRLGQVLQQPQRCAACGIESSSAWTFVRLNADFGFSRCADCSAAAAAKPKKLAALVLLSVSLGLSIPIYFYNSAHIFPAWMLLTLPTVVALPFAALFAWLLFGRGEVPARIRSAPAVQFTHLAPGVRHYLCRNELWARELERVNGITLRPVTALDKSAPPVWAFAGIVALVPLISLATWNSKYPDVFVDNASKEAMQIWVDGQRAALVSAHSDGRIPPTIRVAKGKHRFGFSAADGKTPTHEIEADVTHGNQSLYNPGEHGCYRRKVTLYKTKWYSTGGAEHHERAPAYQDGPISIQEFYELPKIDDWFTESPHETSFGNSSVGYWRIALLRHARCTEMAAKECSLASRQRLISCEMVAKSAADVTRCEAAADEMCR